MSVNLGKEEKLLLLLLKQSLHRGSGGETHASITSMDGFSMDGFSMDALSMDALSMEKVAAMAVRHAVLPLVYDMARDENLWREPLLGWAKKRARVTAVSNYRLLFLTKYVMGLLTQNGIEAVVLKGVAIAAYYPVPELRKSGDVDILVADAGQFGQACTLLEAEGYRLLEHQSARHHREFVTEEGISIELHNSLVEPFESREMNAFLEKLLPQYQKDVKINNGWGIPIRQPGDACHAFYLILHMLQHYLRAGFGLKFLCDWVVFLEHGMDDTEKKKFLAMARESGTEQFVRVITAVCVKYLGLAKERAAFLFANAISKQEEFCRKPIVEEFLQEVFEAGEFGHGTSERMVAMRGTGILAYAGEFHHQMHLNFPRAGKLCILWPALWTATLGRFLYNNRKVRRVSGLKILREAGRRSRVVRKLHLFRK